jgi:hypothetical protein
MSLLPPRLLALVLAAGAGNASALGPTGSLPGYKCVLSEDVGCFTGLPFAFQGGKGFLPSLNRDQSFNVQTGVTLERCAIFCTLHWYTLSAVTTKTSVDGRTNRTSALASCSCGNSTTTAPVANTTCSALPAAGNYTHPPAACVAGTGSCPCSGNSSEACGTAGGLGRVYKSACVPATGPGATVCPLRAGKYMENGSDIPYQAWVDCFGQSILEGVPYLDLPVIMSNSHYAVSPHYSLLCNMTKDPSSWYCGKAVAALKGFADSPVASAAGYHAYEPLLAYQGVVDAGARNFFNSTEMASFQEIIYKGVHTYVGHETRVENHGLDAAIQQLYMMRVFPSMNCSGCAYNVQKLMRIPNQELANWLHGHALDEYAINYDAISIVRLLGTYALIHFIQGRYTHEHFASRSPHCRARTDGPPVACVVRLVLC